MKSCSRRSSGGKNKAADCVTLSRVPFSLLLFCFPPSSEWFAVLYLLCGATDVLDGFLARKLHTESKAGDRLDSIADLVFAAVYAVKILPLLHLPAWILNWTAAIAAVKIFGIIRASRRTRQFSIAHTALNKLTGLMIFLLPLTVFFMDVRVSAAAVCAAATCAAAEALNMNLLGKQHIQI